MSGDGISAKKTVKRQTILSTISSGTAATTSEELLQDVKYHKNRIASVKLKKSAAYA
jgi:hypothetical protein